MKRITILALIVLQAMSAAAQSGYWVFFADKQGSTFDPYTYFDAKAIERYQQCGADLYDITNYPVSASYAAQVNALATEEIGQSRWLNAMGVMATPEQANRIASLPFVLRVQPLSGGMQAASMPQGNHAEAVSYPADSSLADQLVRMQGAYFRAQGIDGRGIRIAVFDGGFPRVNTHEAFRHLRDNHQILKTWNFPNRKENVYGWNSHGTMTLSCIAGREGDHDLGLATGAEFLLARTEVEAEPFKEEVWWMQAVEWADRNGANLISSSLGYGKDRYYTRDMDGTSYVARAGNIAARKGILVCNSAGNEGTDRQWKTIITPSDADSVLCIGGIEKSLTHYSHIDFASYGPSADGRQKPNVCAFAHTQAASPKSDSRYELVYGTSFSCPLVAGFAACAWQASPGKTAMEMFDLIQRSADLYPYCDYAYGYGVPQAGYFTGHRRTATPTFRFERQSATRVSVIPLQPADSIDIFFKDVAPDGSIVRYGQRTVVHFDTTMSLDFSGGHRLEVSCGGFTDSYTFDEPTAPEGSWVRFASVSDATLTYYNAELHNPADERAKESRSEWDHLYMQTGIAPAMGSSEMAHDFSSTYHLGVRYQYHFSRAYGIGIGIDYGIADYWFLKDGSVPVDRMLGVEDMLHRPGTIQNHEVRTQELGIELFQRVRFVPGGIFHKGFHWDLGVYGSYSWNAYRLKISYDNDIASSRSLILRGIAPLDDQRWNYGLTTRLCYDWVGLYARYRLSGLGQEVKPDHILLPRLEVGVQLMF